MDRVHCFFTLQALVTLYAIVRGGAPERIAGWALALAAAATLLLQEAMTTRFMRPDLGVVVVDVVLFGTLLLLTMYADRFWTFWLAALQGLGTASHLVRGLDVEMIRVAYAVLIAVWSYPMMLLVALGTKRHRDRVRRQGYDLDWS